MTGKSRLVASAAGVGLMVLGSPALSTAQQRAPASAATRSASVAPGAIDGMVSDDKGVPVVGAMVSALGPTSAFAVTGRGGRYEIATLEPGSYLVRAHMAGFVAVRPIEVVVRPRTRVIHSLSLRRAPAQAPVLAAGFAGQPALADELGRPTVQALDPEAGSNGVVERDHQDHGETAWRVRHARRGVLKNSTLSGSDEAGDGVYDADSSSFLASIPLSGQFNFLTTGSLERPDQLLTPTGLASGVAYVRVGAPVGDSADWTVRAALTQADVSSWIVAGSYLTREAATHKYDVGLSYSTQRYDGGNPLALRDVADGTRNAAELYGFDTFAVSPALSLNYGARFARYDYLANRNLVSPRFAVTTTPDGETRVSMLVSHRALAPGAEEFLPPGDTGIWLPPQRTFSPIGPGRALESERTTHLAVALERDFANATITLRAFRQRTDGQLVTLFGAQVPGQPDARVGHYLVGSAGDSQATGGAVEFKTPAIASRVNGSVAYSLANAQLNADRDLRYVVLLAPSAIRLENERIHDVSTTIQADVPETATRVFVLYRASNAFARAGAGRTDGDVPRSGFDSRFDVQVHQALPFLNFTSARWEALVAVRNLFRDPADGQSVYDELLVVRPPKRLVGGVTLHF